MQYDLNILLFINGLSGHINWLDHLIAGYTKYGPLLFGGYLIALWFAGKNSVERNENRRNALYAFFSVFLAMTISKILGIIWYRNRPYIDHSSVHQLVSAKSDASFPSDHAVGSFSIAGSVLFGRSIGGIILTFMAIMLALSRVYVGVHYPSDIVGGMAVGLLSSMIINKNKELLEKPVGLLLSMWSLIETNIISVIFRSGHSKENYRNS